MDLSGKVALITGAGRGIGLAIATAMAAHGAAVAIQDIDLDVAEAEASKLRDQGAQAVAFGGDMGDLAMVDGLVPRVVGALGALDILVNNAAIQAHGHWTGLDAAEIERIFRTNVTSLMVLMRHAVAPMKAKRWGRIINIGSVQGRSGNTHMAPYAMSKAAMTNFGRAMARELARDNITVNTILPGWFNTYRNRDDFPDPQALIDKGRRVPMGRIGEPTDCAGAAVLLASDDGAYITAQEIVIDGGVTA